MINIKAPKKLIEVALPLDDINAAAAREKSIRHGHPSTLHLWWARRPLAAARAVLFAQLVNDPGGERGWYAGKTKAQADLERERLFDIIRDLVKWENTNNEDVLERAREAIRESWRETCALNKGKPGFDPDKLPAFHDPFAGGGSIPLEAQRLGLEAHASDLNPVAILINKAMIEIPPRFAGRPPVHSDGSRAGKSGTGQVRLFKREWKGAEGLAEDVRYYGQWMRDEAFKRIGHLYPPVEITPEMVEDPTNPRPDLKPYVGKKLTVIACIWARTVKSPNPAFSTVDVPLALTFMLSTKAGKEAYVEPLVEEDGYRFTVKVGTPSNAVATTLGTSAGKWKAFRCLMSQVPISYSYIREQGLAGRMSSRLMAIVVEGNRARLYISPTAAMEAVALQAQPLWRPELEINYHPRDIKTPIYGLTRYGDLFTERQLVALNTFSDLVREVAQRVRDDASATTFEDDGKALHDGGIEATAYGEAVAVYIACAMSKVTNIGSAIASWMSDRGAFRETFARQAIPMTWDYAEANPFADAGGSLGTALDKGAMVIEAFPATIPGFVYQADAATQPFSSEKVVSTDPPYYDNIGYADLSDYFYVWLRRALKDIFPSLFATMAVPKAEELVASPYRHGNKEKAEAFFLDGMSTAMQRLAKLAHQSFPVTIYYAFKQADNESDLGASNTGWETFLDAVINAGFTIGGTWPIRTEGSGRIMANNKNALASSIILVCRKRDPEAPSISRRDFQRELRDEMPDALETHDRRQAGHLAHSPGRPGPGRHWPWHGDLL